MKNKDNETITFRRRDFKGSKFRCLRATSQPREKVRELLQQLVKPYAEMPDDAQWIPNGFLEPTETVLMKAPTLLNEHQQSELENWWLAIKGKSVPNWDLVANCKIFDKDGLVLVEAKAHEGELHEADDTSRSTGDNAKSIRDALAEAEAGLNQLEPGFSLSADSHYQLCNRFAFSWKLAKMGIPIVLIYLGFLDAEEMEGRGNIVLRSQEQWKSCVERKSSARIPKKARGNNYEVDGTSLTFLARSARASVSCEVA